MCKRIYRTKFTIMALMTFCASVSNKEKLGFKDNVFCPYNTLNEYKARVSADGGTFEADQCVLDYIIKNKIE